MFRVREMFTFPPVRTASLMAVMVLGMTLAIPPTKSATRKRSCVAQKNGFYTSTKIISVTPNVI